MGFLEKIIHGLEPLIRFLRDAAQSAKRMFLDFFPDKKHRLMVGAGAGVLVVLIFTAAALSGSSGKNERVEVSDRMRAVIPVEDIFLPDEPDFVPEVLLERERRSIWTEDDSGEYWQDPLKYGEERWREKIEAAIDDYMERIP